jgi:hypothetical protein
MDNFLFSISSPFFPNRGVPKPGYLEIDFMTFYDNFRETYGQSYLSIRRLANNEIDCTDFLSEELLADAMKRLTLGKAISEEISEDTSVFIIEKKMIYIKRAKINKLKDILKVNVPNKFRIDYEKIMIHLINGPWAKKVASREWSNNNLTERIMERANKDGII